MRGQEVSQEDSRAALGEYITALYQKLEGPSAVGIKAWLDAPPKKGDVIFINDMEHVCLSVGVQELDKVGKTHCVMSLWYHDEQRYTMMPFEELADYCKSKELKVRPCPF
jgi:hypothetical protein